MCIFYILDWLEGYRMEKLSANITKRKDGRFMGKFIIGYDDSGKAQYQYVYGKTYDEAESKMLIGQEVASRYLSDRYITVGKVYEEWLNAVVNRVKESSLANYKAKFEKHILPVFADTPCSDLSAGHINEFINKKLADGLSASYVRDIITVFKSMLRYAQEEYGFKLSLKNVVLPKVEKKQIEKVNDTEQKRLISYLKANISLTAFGILLSLCMGLRIGELCGLKWGDVDFQHKILHIRRTVQRITSANGNRKTKKVITTPKSSTSFRDIAIPDFLMEYFRMFRDESDFFILSGAEKPVEPRTMQYRYKKILQFAEIENHNYHKLRHTFATNCAEKGFDIKTLSMVLGHSTVNLSVNTPKGHTHTINNNHAISIRNRNLMFHASGPFLFIQFTILRREDHLGFWRCSCMKYCRDRRTVRCPSSSSSARRYRYDSCRSIADPHLLQHIRDRLPLGGGVIGVFAISLSRDRAYESRSSDQRNKIHSQSVLFMRLTTPWRLCYNNSIIMKQLHALSKTVSQRKG